jgi:hypothetical protein
VALKIFKDTGGYPVGRGRAYRSTQTGGKAGHMSITEKQTAAPVATYPTPVRPDDDRFVSLAARWARWLRPTPNWRSATRG